jgi:hypothetical protein
MVETMDDGIVVWDFDAGSADLATRKLWRRNRNAAYRAGYKEINGKSHPASRSGQPKKDLEKLLEETDPPKGMSWKDFGILWDLHQEHPFTPVLRKRPVSDEWDRLHAPAASD